MELFPPRPRFRPNRKQFTCALGWLVVANLAAFGLAEYDAAAQRDRHADQARLAATMPGPRPAQTPASALALRRAVLFVVINALTLAALAYAFCAVHLERLRRYELCIPTGFDEHRLKPHHQRPPTLGFDPSEPRRIPPGHRLNGWI